MRIEDINLKCLFITFLGRYRFVILSNVLINKLYALPNIRYILIYGSDILFIMRVVHVMY